MDRFSEGQDRESRNDDGPSGLIVYFSSVSEMTKSFVDRTGMRSSRIPVRRTEDHLRVEEPYILITPSYGAGNGTDSVPKQVIKFLNDPINRSHLIGVAGGGSRNYGAKFCLAPRIVAAKCEVPLIFTYELLGLPEDIDDFLTIADKVFHERTT